MKFLFILILFFFFGSIQILAQEKTVTEFPMKNSSLLWKIEGPGVQKGSYLFGTMHLIEKEYFLFPDKLQKIIKKSDQIVMELAGLPNQKEALKLIQLKEGSFFDFFTPEQTDSILEWALVNLKLDEKSFRATMNKMKPFFVIQMGTQMHFIGKTESYELNFEKLAKENNIKIIGLETIAEQMAIFDNLTKEQQSEMVMEGVRNTDKDVETTKKLQEVYTRQNVDSLFIMIKDEGGILSSEQNEFLDKRNQNWIPHIKNLISDKKTFIAVGAGHLGGPNGLIRLLEKEGYTLTPVSL